MSLLIALATAAAIAGSPPAAAPETDEAARAARAARLAGLPAADRDIQVGLWRALETDPKRVVCASHIATGTKMPRQTCGSLQEWFDARTPGEIAERMPPSQLVEEIKVQRRKVLRRQGQRASRSGDPR